MSDEPWNHNIHYHELLLAALPQRCGRVLDVGCGEGILARKLRARSSHVTAIDVDARSIDLARAHSAAGEIDYVLGDFLVYPFRPASFDAVVCVAALHHMDTPAALERMRDLLHPGGTLAVLGLPRSRYPRDLLRDGIATTTSRALRLRHTHWESPAPTVWPPTHTFREMKRLAAQQLPGAAVRRHLLFRYSIVWTKPPTADGYPALV